MNKIFTYTNYRSALKDFFEEQKAAHGYTYRDFSMAAGMNSSSWLMHLIRGTKNLSFETADRVAKVLSLGSHEREYFHLLVDFTQARESDEKDRYYRQMLELKKRLKLVHISEKYYDYYTKWYHPVVRSLASKVDFNEDYSLLAKRLVPPISAAEAKRSVKLLVKLGLIEKTPAGAWIQKSSAITTGDEVTSLNVVNYHKQVSRLAEGAFDHTPRELRDISALTLGVSAKDALIIKEKIQSFRKEIIEIAKASENADRVYQLNVHYFPVSRWEEEKQ
jgi:uncharacterized protein (TIGR02147 family)